MEGPIEIFPFSLSLSLLLLRWGLFPAIFGKPRAPDCTKLELKYKEVHWDKNCIWPWDWKDCEKRDLVPVLPGFDFSTTIITDPQETSWREKKRETLSLSQLVRQSISHKRNTGMQREEDRGEKERERELFLGNTTSDASGSLQGISHSCFIFQERKWWRRL